LRSIVNHPETSRPANRQGVHYECQNSASRCQNQYPMFALFTCTLFTFCADSRCYLEDSPSLGRCLRSQADRFFSASNCFRQMTCMKEAREVETHMRKRSNEMTQSTAVSRKSLSPPRRCGLAGGIRRVLSLPDERSDFPSWAIRDFPCGPGTRFSCDSGNGVFDNAFSRIPRLAFDALIDQ
jgi:hypothetical protein